jgi:ferredoxin-NADP reductase
MEKHIVKILDTFFVTHDVKSFIVERPDNYQFLPGQATELAIFKEGWKDEKRPFTFTNLPGDEFLQFIIKIYPSREGLTNELLKAKIGDKLIISEVFGTIKFQGRGTFIAGGAGITPFIAILRNLRKTGELFGNKLIFANKRREDIILEKEFKGLLGDKFINILSKEKVKGYHYGVIKEDFLKSHIAGSTGKFYLCGPPPMMDEILDQLSSLGIADKTIIKEEF